MIVDVCSLSAVSDKALARRTLFLQWPLLLIAGVAGADVLARRPGAAPIVARTKINLSGHPLIGRAHCQGWPESYTYRPRQALTCTRAVIHIRCCDLLATKRKKNLCIARL